MIALLCLPDPFVTVVLWLFLTVPWVGLVCSLIVVFPVFVLLGRLPVWMILVHGVTGRYRCTSVL